MCALKTPEELLSRCCVVYMYGSGVLRGLLGITFGQIVPFFFMLGVNQNVEWFPSPFASESPMFMLVFPRGWLHSTNVVGVNWSTLSPTYPRDMF